MHQTFYIDVDEEISSVIDRLNKSMSIENYFVVPKRALFFQSIVNLKILKREADKVGKMVTIVTQDEIGYSMAHRSGIDVRENLDGLENPIYNASLPKNESDTDQDFEDEADENFEQETDFLPKQDKQIRLNSIGTGDYYQQKEQHVPAKPALAQRSAKAATSREPKLTTKSRIKSLRPEKIVLEKVPAKTHVREQISAPKNSPLKSSEQISAKGNIYKKQLDPYKAQSLERMFSNNGQYGHAKEKKPVEIKNIGSGRFRNVFAMFMFFSVLIFIGVAGFLFIPSAKIVISSNVSVQKINEDIQGSAAISESGQSTVPLRVIELNDQQVAVSYQVEGKAAVSGKKAHGTVVIYNEYSNESQTLIATTRLESADGKIFRISKNVVVPGYSNVAGQIKPGAIQAEVVADQAGSDYNLEATKFTIPGFAGSPKFDKFYANSTDAMVGGSTEGQIATGGVVAQGDLDGAKQKTETIFKEKINEAIKSQLSPGEIALPQAEKITIAHSSSTAKIGTVSDSFDWVVSGSVKALVFSEQDIKNVLVALEQDDKQKSDMKQEISKIDYGSVEADFDALALKLKVYGEITSTPNIDSEKIKKELLGKNDDQLADILRKYSSIKSANVEFSPTFISRVPQYPSRVTVEIKNDAQ